jgi:hypothetical protein
MTIRRFGDHSGKIGISRKSLSQSVLTDPTSPFDPPIDSPRLPKSTVKEPPAFCAHSGKPVHVVTGQLSLKAKHSAHVFSNYDEYQ